MEVGSQVDDPRYSEIETFWLRHPQADAEQIHNFTGEVTSRLCDCGQTMRRFETWNGHCEECRREQGEGHRDECGCYDSERQPLSQMSGWHTSGRDASTRCPRYWNGRKVAVEITKKEAGRKIKRAAELEFHLGEDGLTLERTYYVDGRAIDVSGKRGDFVDYA